MSFLNGTTQIPFSGSTQGQPIKVVATATPGTLIHTTGTPLYTTQYDKIYLRLVNTSAADVLATVEFGGTTSPDNTIPVNVPAQGGVVVAIDGEQLSGNGSAGLNVRVFAASANVVLALGFVARVTPLSA